MAKAVNESALDNQKPQQATQFNYPPGAAMLRLRPWCTSMYRSGVAVPTCWCQPPGDHLCQGCTATGAACQFNCQSRQVVDTLRGNSVFTVDKAMPTCWCQPLGGHLCQGYAATGAACQWPAPLEALTSPAVKLNH